ncbi:hypothetical protein [Streptococcus equi]|nr:hypothetical protein [Streptococcus equi]MDI5990490.1 hypothetical protein [Streptococcus equi subsp. zooepidemicus]MDI6001615.1 hypothetical protein [Streptococcus equi subsp. zooepidemicus]WOK53419.1 hypothetical protein RIM62_00505 [Streptococcus equi subsp. zooepidemicus]WOK55365.1 hypothetical protein RIM64_00505 [Streptococcus equi subsp. zooepidemicus]
MHDAKRIETDLGKLGLATITQALNNDKDRMGKYDQASTDMRGVL